MIFLEQVCLATAFFLGFAALGLLAGAIFYSIEYNRFNPYSDRAEDDKNE